MKRFLLATLLAWLASGPLMAQCSDNCSSNGGWYGQAKGMPKYVEKPKDTRTNDQALTIAAVAGGVLISLVAFACFFKESLALSGPRPQRPWDV